MKHLKVSVFCLLAVALAVGFSAFTSALNTKQAEEGKSLQSNHWYTVDPNDPDELTGYLGFMTKVAASTLTECEDEIEPICARGYGNLQHDEDEDEFPVNTGGTPSAEDLNETDQ